MSKFRELATKPGKVLEIGIGGAYSPPNPTMLVPVKQGKQPARRFTGDASYTGVDRIFNPHDKLYSGAGVGENPQWPANILDGIKVAKSLLANNRPEENINFAVADATALPFANLKFDEVFFGDVLGSNLDKGVRETMLAEADRVLKLGCRIVIHETICSNWSEPDLLQDQASKLGLRTMVKAPAGTPEYDELTAIYGAGQGDTKELNEHLYGLPYFHILEK